MSTSRLTDMRGDIASAKADLPKTIISSIVVNAAVVIGAMIGRAKLLGH